MKKTSLALSISLVLGSQVALANPSGPQVVHGTATFSNPSANVLNVTNSRNAIINWQSFNIGQGQTTNFFQPSASSSVMNRVISNNPSQLLGNLNSNGKVFLINQNGILVGANARINTGGFFASTLNITDQDFLNGRLKFEGGGAGGIENRGYIHATDDGNIVLIAPNIENSGVISTDNGNVMLAAGESITISSLENPAMQFAVTADDNSVTNLGSVIARRGAATMFAGTLRHSGSVRATGMVQDADGTIRLVATDTATVSGKVDVSSNETAGRVEILGEVVALESGADIDASGGQLGGEVLIGGDQQGLNPAINNATTTSVEKGARVSADGVGAGDGGRVIVFAEDDVHVHGEITARGGEQGGDGGFIETSGLRQLDITSVPDASAPNGQAGEWLIDPNDITIQALGPDDNILPGGTNPRTFDSEDDSAILTTTTIEAALNAGTSVTVTTTSSGANTEDGDINVIDPILSSPTSSLVTLSLNADNDINIDAGIDMAGYGGNLDFNAGNDININAPLIVQSSAGLPIIDLTADNDVNLAADVTSNFSGLNFNLTADADAIGGGAVTLDGSVPIIIDTDGTSTITFNSPQSFIVGDVSIGTGDSSSIDLVLNTAMEVSGNLKLGTGAAEQFVFSTGPIDITSSGAMSIDSSCGIGCGQIRFNNNVTNNGLVEMIQGGISIQASFVNNGILSNNSSGDVDPSSGVITVGDLGPAVFTAGPGSQIINPGTDARKFFIGPIGELRVDNPLIFPQIMTLSLDQGTITNAQNLTLPNPVEINNGANINGNSNGALVFTETSSLDSFGGYGGELRFNGAGPGDQLVIDNEGEFLLRSGGVTDDMLLNNAEFINFGVLDIQELQVSGVGGTLRNFGVIGAVSGDTEIDNVSLAFDNRGVLEAKPGELLILNDSLFDLLPGATLAGTGAFQIGDGTGTLNVDGGTIYAALFGDRGDINVNGDVTFTSGTLISMMSDSEGLNADTLVANTVDVTSGNILTIWEAGVDATNSIADNFDYLVSCTATDGCVTGGANFIVSDAISITGSTLVLGDDPSYLNIDDALVYTLTGLDNTLGKINVWLGSGDGVSWSDSDNWELGEVPGVVANNTQDQYVFIENGSGLSTVNLADTYQVPGLQSFGNLDIQGGGNLTIDGDAVIVNDALFADSVLRFSAPDARIDGLGVLYSLPGTKTDLNQGILVKDMVNWGAVTTKAGSSFQLERDLANFSVIFLDDLPGANTITGSGSITNHAVLDFGDAAILELDGDITLNSAGSEAGYFQFPSGASDGLIRLSGASKFEILQAPGFYGQDIGWELNGGAVLVAPGVNLFLDIPIDFLAPGGDLVIDGLLSNAGDMTINHSTGSARISGTGSYFNGGNILQTSADDFSVSLTSFSGPGNIGISNGNFLLQTPGSVPDGNLVIAAGATFTVDNLGSLFTGSTFGGISGGGNLVVNSGGLLDFDVWFGKDLSSLGAFNINGGTVRNVQDTILPNNFNLSDTALVQGDGNLVIPSTATVNVNGGFFSGISDTQQLLIDHQGTMDIFFGQALNLQFADLQVASAASLTGAGRLDLTADATLSGDNVTIDVDGIILNGGEIFANDLTYTGNFDWQAGDISGPGPFITAGLASVQVGANLLTDWTIGSGGLANLVGAVALGGGNDIVVETGGTLDLGTAITDLSGLGAFTVDGGTVQNVQDALLPASFNIGNNGVVGGDGSLLIPSTTTVSIDNGTLRGVNAGQPLTIDHQGTMDILNGQLELLFADLNVGSAGSVNLLAATNLNGNGTLQLLTTGTLTGNTASVDVASLTLDGGEIVANDLTYTGNFDWQSGIISGTGPFTTNGPTAVQGGADLQTSWIIPAAGSGIIQGDVTFSTGDITIASGADLTIATAAGLTLGPSFGPIGGGGNLLVDLGGFFNLGTGVKDLSGLGALNVNGGTVSNIQDTLLPVAVNLGNNGILTGAGTLDITTATILTVGNGINAINNLSVNNEGTIEVIAGQTLTLNNTDLTVVGGTGLLTGAGQIVLPSTTQLTMDGTVDIAQVALTGGTFTANNPAGYAGTLLWADGLVNGNGLTTPGQVILTRGILDTNWLNPATGSVTWVGTSADTLAINSGDITNQGLLLINGQTPTDRFDLVFDNDGGTIGIQSGIFRNVDNLGTPIDLVLDQPGDTLQGFGTFEGNVINTSGTVTPGRSDPAAQIFQPGTLTITGDYTQEIDGKLFIKLDSTVQDNTPVVDNDTLRVNGTLFAGGDLNFEVVNNKSPVEIALLLDQSFRPFEVGSFDGSFDNVSIPPGLNFTLGPGGVITITSDNTQLNKIANELEVLFENEDLNHEEMVQAMKFVDRRIELLGEPEEDEDERKRAPRLVCK